MVEHLPVYEVRARNTSADSENKIHDDRVAASYGFSGGLVPGVTVFGYLTVPVVTRFPDWLERGSMQVRFLQPFYEGDRVVVRAEAAGGDEGISIKVIAQGTDGTIRATGEATIDNGPARNRPRISDYETRPLPSAESRLLVASSALVPGTVLGTLVETLDLMASQQGILKQIGEELPVYFGEAALAHPVLMLGLANQMFVRNVALGPWIHASSELTNFSPARDGEVVTVRGFIADQFERKGHEFVVLDLLLAAGDRLLQQVRHTAIYSIRPA